MMNEKRTAIYNARISRVLEAGTGLKAHIKEAKDALNHFYEDLIEDANKEDNMKHVWERPFNLHQIRPKHEEFFPAEIWSKVQELVETRKAIEELPVATREIKNNPEQKIRLSILEQMQKNRENFDIVKATLEELVKIVDDEALVTGVSVRGHYCQNYFGTTWIRFDWYLMGEKVPFNHIAAAVGMIKDERTK